MQGDLESSTATGQVKSLAALLRSATRGSQIMEGITQQARAACKPLQAGLASLLTGIENVELQSAGHTSAGQILEDAGEGGVVVRALDADEGLIGLFCFRAADLSALVNNMCGSVYQDRLPAPVAATHMALAREISKVLLRELVSLVSVPGTAGRAHTFKEELTGEMPGRVPPAEGVVFRLAVKGEHESASLILFVPGNLCARTDDQSGDAAESISSMAVLREIKQTRVPLSVVLEERQQSLQDLALLHEGSLLSLDLCLGQPVQVDAGGTRLFSGNLDQSNDCFRIVVHEFLYRGEE
jgi:flagellar motor switch/type III secretory pathway protein FliN